MVQNSNNQGDPSVSKSFFDYINPGYIVAGISTLITAWLSVGYNFSRYIYERKIPKFMKLEQDKNEAYEALFNRKDGNLAEFLKDKVECEKQYDTKYAGFLKEAGIKNTFDKWRALKGYQQWQVGLTVATVAAIALGATYSFTRNKKLAEQMRQQERSRETQLQQS